MVIWSEWNVFFKTKLFVVHENHGRAQNKQDFKKLLKEILI